MAIPAIHTQVAGVQLVAEVHRLDRRVADLEVLIGAVIAERRSRQTHRRQGAEPQISRHLVCPPWKQKAWHASLSMRGATSSRERGIRRRSFAHFEWPSAPYSPAPFGLARVPRARASGRRTRIRCPRPPEPCFNPCSSNGLAAAAARSSLKAPRRGGERSPPLHPMPSTTPRGGTEQLST